MKKSKKLSDQEVIDYVTKELGMPKDVCVCKDCGKVVRWKDTTFNFLTTEPRSGVYTKWKKLKCYSSSFMTEREYNGNIYHLSYCYECACNHFKEIPNKKFPLNPATKRSKFLFQISEEDFSVLTDKVCRRTKENYIKNFGETEGLRRWNCYCQKQSESNTFEYKQKKFGWTKEQFQKFNNSRAVTLENLVKKYGEDEGIRIWEQYKDKQRESCSKNYFLKTYGEEEGLRKWNNWQERKSKFHRTSIIADEFFSMLGKYYEGNEIYSYSANSKEFRVESFNLDYYDKTLNVVVEFNGDFWHANPDKNINPEQFENKCGLTIEEKWKKDKVRNEFIESYLNTKVFVVWEKDFRNNKEECVQKIVSEINEYVKPGNYNKLDL